MDVCNQGIQVECLDRFIQLVVSEPVSVEDGQSGLGITVGGFRVARLGCSPQAMLGPKDSRDLPMLAMKSNRTEFQVREDSGVVGNQPPALPGDQTGVFEQAFRSDLHGHATFLPPVLLPTW